MSDRQGVEIDYCPNCRGVWLDRGELDKIIQRANQWEEDHSMTPPHGDPVTRGGRGSRHGYRDEDDDDRGRRGKRKPFWMEIFD